MNKVTLLFLSFLSLSILFILKSGIEVEKEIYIFNECRPVKLYQHDQVEEHTYSLHDNPQGLPVSYYLSSQLKSYRLGYLIEKKYLLGGSISTQDRGYILKGESEESIFLDEAMIAKLQAQGKLPVTLPHYSLSIWNHIPIGLLWLLLIIFAPILLLSYMKNRYRKEAFSTEDDSSSITI